MAIFGTSRLEKMQDEVCDFVNALHVNNYHVGQLLDFDSEVRVRPPTTKSEELTDQIEEDLSTGGKTALNEAVCAGIDELRSWHYGAGRGDVPMMVLIFTDGKENKSDIDAKDVRQKIRTAGFVPEHNCYLAIAGIGDADEDQLKALTANQHGLYAEEVDSIEAVVGLWAQVVLHAVPVPTKLRRELLVALKRGELEAHELLEVLWREIPAVRPIDYCLVVDTSGSMSRRC